MDATLQNLLDQRKRATDAKEYDHLTAEIAKATHESQRNESIQTARHAAEVARERESQLAEHKATLRKIEGLYSECAALDEKILQAAEQFITLTAERFEKGALAEMLTAETIDKARAQGFPQPRQREEGLFGGNLVRHSAHRTARLPYYRLIWLQRVGDSLAEHGEVDREYISQHGYRGNLGNNDGLPIDLPKDLI